MAEKIDARDFIFEVSEDPTIVTPVWAEVHGLESFDLNPSENEESVDTTDFDSQGVHESQPMQRGASVSLEGKIVRTAGVQDAGQVSCQDLAALTGEAAKGGLRFRHNDDEDWTVWTAWVSLGSQGGGINDKTSFAATFTRSGAATTDAVA